jgi:hypothetical protein
MMITVSNSRSGMSTWTRRGRGRKGGRGRSGSTTTMISRISRKRGGLRPILPKISRPARIQQHPYLPNMKASWRVQRMLGRSSSLTRLPNQPSSSGNTTEFRSSSQRIPTLSRNSMSEKAYRVSLQDRTAFSSLPQEQERHFAI